MSNTGTEYDGVKTAEYVKSLEHLKEIYKYVGAAAILVTLFSSEEVNRLKVMLYDFIRHADEGIRRYDQGFISLEDYNMVTSFKKIIDEEATNR